MSSALSSSSVGVGDLGEGLTVAYWPFPPAYAPGCRDDDDNDRNVNREERKTGETTMFYEKHKMHSIKISF